MTLTIAWPVGEFAGLRRSLDHSLRERPAFYALALAIAPVFIATSALSPDSGLAGASG